MLYYIGRAMQVVALLQVGTALFIGVTQEGAVRYELQWLGIGVAIFLTGKLLERKGASG
jgi:hypothetical protein